MSSKPSLPKRYDSKEVEARWQEYWEEKGIYKFNPESDQPIYSIDTPPPTVSGKLHIGHVFSYTHTEILARYFRMKGHNVYYPMGWDDNGLPSEKLTLDVLEKERGEKDLQASDFRRQDFIEKCLEVTEEHEREMEELWRQLGLSIDWTLTYSTIEDRTRRISQRSFIDLFEKEKVYRSTEPMIWCPHKTCKTAIAQAELETKPFDSYFNDLKFKLEDGKDLIIATTRPELLPACVAIFVHPDDDRYKELVGKQARVPIFGQLVEVLPDGHVDPEKGTGVVMCCTFGDRQDIEWWKTMDLDLKVAITEDGRMNELAEGYEGLTVKEARKKIIEDLEKEGLLASQKKIVHDVQTHERCNTPVEFITKSQWFIKVLESKEELIGQADKINWYPAFMKSRYTNWVENLAWDWCISRQRFYGVPFPVWFCEDCGKVKVAQESELPVDPLKDEPSGPCECGSENFQGDSDVMDTWATSSLTPDINWGWGEEDEERDLSPMSLRPQAHEIIRTWAFYTIVKSLYHHNSIPWENVAISGFVTPPKYYFLLGLNHQKKLRRKQISGQLRKDFKKEGIEIAKSARLEALEDKDHWLLKDGENDNYFLIRREHNVKSFGVYPGEEYLDETEVDKRRKRGKEKISKSKHGDKYSPKGLLDQYSADCLRLWAANAPLGSDMPLHLEDFKQMDKILNKIWNAFRFMEMHLKDFDGKSPEKLTGIDEYMLYQLNETIRYSSQYFEEYDFRTARLQIDEFFRGTLCDDFIEIAKDRLYNPDSYKEWEVASARYALYTCGYYSLRLFAPFVPHLVEELYQTLYREKEGVDSIHETGWPKEVELSEEAEVVAETGKAFIEALYYIRKVKGNRKMSMKDEIDTLEVTVHPDRQKYFERDLDTLKATAKVGDVVFAEGDEEYKATLSIEGEEKELVEFSS